MTITIREIVKKFLLQNNYDGLFCNKSDPCGCEVDSLFLCDIELLDDCKAGYKIPCTCENNCDWHIGPKPINRNRNYKVAADHWKNHVSGFGMVGKANEKNEEC